MIRTTSIIYGMAIASILWTAPNSPRAQTSTPNPLPILKAELDPNLDPLLAPRKRGWLGADGAASVLLPDGRILWIFADTVVGRMDKGKRDGPMIRNSVAIQKSGSRNPQDVSFWWRLPDRIPDALFPPPTDNSPFWYWPGCAVEIRGILYAFMMKQTIRQGPGVSEAFGFRSVGCTLFRIPNPTDPPDQWKTSQVDIFKGDEHININAAALIEGKYVYLLGYSDGPSSNTRDRAAILTRLPIAALESTEPGRELEFLSRGGAWRPSPDRLEYLFRPAPTESSFHYDPVRRRYIAAVIPPFTTELCLVSSEKLTGPWSPLQKVFEIENVAGKGHFAYAARAHPELSQNPQELFLTYIVNSDNMWNMYGNCDIYYPRFVRVTFQEPKSTEKRPQNE